MATSSPLRGLDTRTLLSMIHHWADCGEAPDRLAGESLRWAFLLHLRDVACDTHAARVPWSTMTASEIDDARRATHPNAVSALSIAMACCGPSARYFSPSWGWSIFCECMDAAAQEAARLWLLAQLLGEP